MSARGLYGVCGIYKIKCLPTGKRYVGQSINVGHRIIEHKSDLRAGRHHNFHLQRAWGRYGEQAFSFSLLEQVEVDGDKLYERESYWMDKYRSLSREHGFNITKDKNAYFGFSPEQKQAIREKLSKALSGKRNPNYGKRISPEQRGRLRETWLGKVGPNLGRKWPPEMREKISLALRGENHPFHGKRRPGHSARMKGAGNPRAKRIVCITTGEEFGCAKDAERKYGVTNSMILKCCKGVHQYGGKLSDGTRLRWRYA